MAAGFRECTETPPASSDYNKTKIMVSGCGYQVTLHDYHVFLLFCIVSFTFGVSTLNINIMPQEGQQ